MDNDSNRYSANNLFRAHRKETSRILEYSAITGEYIRRLQKDLDEFNEQARQFVLQSVKVLDATNKNKTSGL